MNTLSDKTIQNLKKLAQRETWHEQLQDGESIVDDFAGGNIDDAYEGGREDGEAMLAQDILTELGVNFKE